MHRRGLALLLTVTTAVIAATYIGWPGDGTAASRPASRSDGYAAVFNDGELPRLIGRYEDRVAAHPNPDDFGFLGQLYLQRGRQTGDLQTYLQAESAVTQAVALDPTSEGNQLELGSVRYTTHDFAGAASVAGRVLGTDPSSVGGLVLSGDAHLELGDYAEAERDYDNVAARTPRAPAIEVRQARLDFVLGRTDEAVEMAKKAERDAEASALGGTDLAYYETYQGQVELDAGHYDQGLASYRKALVEAPGYYVALAGMGRALALEGRTREAIGYYEKAVAIVPQPDFLAALGDLDTLVHRTAGASREYGTISVISQLATINRQVYNRLVVLYDADHGVRPDEALRLASAELAVRRDVYGYDADAWALYENGRYQEARDAEGQALAVGTVDPKLLYHAGMIAKALGDTVGARSDLSQALRISPRFDPLQARRARAALGQLSGPGQ